MNPQGKNTLYRFAVTLNKFDQQLIDALQVESNTATEWISVTKEVDGLTINFSIYGNIRYTDGYKISRTDGGNIMAGLASQVISAWVDAGGVGDPTSYGVWENGTKVFPT